MISKLVSGAAVLAIATTALVSPRPVAAADAITVGVIPIVDVAPIYLGVKKGFFEKRGLNVTLTTGQGGSFLLPSIISGQFQFGFSNVISTMLAESRGVKLRAVAAGISSTGKAGADFSAIVVPKDSPITSAKELEGKVVSNNAMQSIGDISINQAIRAAGGDPSKVKFVEIPFPNVAPALANKQVDAAWVVEPFVTITRSQGAKVIAWNMVDTAPKIMISTYFTTLAYAEKNPDIVKRFAEAMNESLTYASAHHDEVRAIVPTYTKITPELAAKIVLPDWPIQMNRQSTELVGKLAVEAKILPSMPDLSKFWPPGATN